MKKHSFLAGMISMLLLVSLIVPTFAKNEAFTATLTYKNISVILDGEKLNLKDATGAQIEPFIINGTTYLPVRAISDALGLNVGWDGNTSTVILTSKYNQEFNTSSILTQASVVRIIDGDTIVVNIDGVEETVRLIGVDTPESVHPDTSKNTDAGDAASKFTKYYLSNQDVELEFDIQERDKYNRLLAYVYTKEGMFNEKLLHTGYGNIATYPPNVKYADKFSSIVQNRDPSIPSKKYLNGYMEAPIAVYNTSVEYNKMDSSLLYVTGKVIFVDKSSDNAHVTIQTQNGYATIVNPFNCDDFKALSVGDIVTVGMVYSMTQIDSKNNINMIGGAYTTTLKLENQETYNQTQTENQIQKEDQNTKRTVYVTKTGKKYHYDGNCNGGTYYTSTLAEAKSRGLTPCSKCVR